jgi:hypothetical protein
MNFKPFYQLIHLYAERKMSRQHFILNWGLLQRDMGINLNPVMTRPWCR